MEFFYSCDLCSGASMTELANVEKCHGVLQEIKAVLRRSFLRTWFPWAELGSPTARSTPAELPVGITRAVAAPLSIAGIQRESKRDRFRPRPDGCFRKEADTEEMQSDARHYSADGCVEKPASDIRTYAQCGDRDQNQTHADELRTREALTQDRDTE